MKKVLIVAYYFPPLGWSGVQRTLKFVKYLRSFGWEPIVVTVGETKFSVFDDTLLNEIPEGIEVVKIDDVKFKGITDTMKEALKSYVNTSFDFISNDDLVKEYENEIEKKFCELRDLLLLPDGNAIWANNVIKEINRSVKLKDIDVVYTTSAPYSSHLVGLHIKNIYNIPWVADFRDEWINNPYCDYDEDGIKFKIENAMEESVVANCNKIITTTPQASENFIKRYDLNDKSVVTITNGYDENDFKYIRKSQGKNSKFTIIHNGSCYLNRSPKTFFKAVRNLIENNMIDSKKIKIVFIGSNDKEVMEISKKEICKYDIVCETGYLSHEESLNLTMNADLLLLIGGIIEKQKSVFPGKVFEYLRMQKSILAISPHGSVIEELLEETNSGKSFQETDIIGMENFINEKYNIWDQNIDKVMPNIERIKQYERKVLTSKLVEVFEKLL